MNKFKWLLLFLFSLIFLTLIVVTFIYDPVTEQNPNATVDTEEINEPVQENTEEDSPDDVLEEENLELEEEGSVSEGLREVFSSVLDSARNLFVREDLRVVSIGDSLTQGVGDGTDNGGYVGILEDTINENDEAADFTIDNFGKRGDRTDQLLDRMESAEMSSAIREADLVLITIGANNVVEVIENNFTSLSYDHFAPAREEYREELEEILSNVESLNPNASIYLIGLYNPFNQYFDNIPALTQIMNEWNSVSENVVQEHPNASFIPINDVFEENEDELLWEEDHFHPNEKGYKRMAERILENIRNEIQQ
ncbi:GDSL-type esterase/lipase family protein [Halobacillus sp. A1]|uniref:GDSL-type esterase/lipase family protein n=1 Tax=Halobacillus sp. A1 TaxID=2880262 RepID=UPI0020A671AC|nr:GDSL-type esterase/lipase family protein [Halobacillus sp. A1]MCP3031009.1 GDSL-type esterase/lipase family protein [Halobacillus sp. A1]